LLYSIFSAGTRLSAKASPSNGCISPFIKNLLPSNGRCFADVFQQQVYTLRVSRTTSHLKTRAVRSLETLIISSILQKIYHD
jgi:hypothetical protein